MTNIDAGINFMKIFDDVMSRAPQIALASVMGATPNVRIVNFVQKDTHKDVIYVPTFKKSPKTKEFSQNSKVAFTTLPVDGHSLVRVKEAIAFKSAVSVEDMYRDIVKKYPGMGGYFEQFMKAMTVIEIRFNEVFVVAGLNIEAVVAV